MAYKSGTALVASNGSISLRPYQGGGSGDTNAWLRLTPAEASSAPFSFVHATYSNEPTTSRKNQVMSWGWNVGTALTSEATFQFTIESYYDAGLGPVTEFYIATDKINGGAAYRPFTIDLTRSNGQTAMVLRPTTLEIQRWDTNAVLWSMNTSSGGPQGYMQITSAVTSTPISWNTNDVAFLKQKGAGAYFVDMFKIDTSDRLVLGQDNTDVRVARDLYITRGIGAYGTSPPASQPSTTGQVVGFTSGNGNAAKDDSTFTGGSGSKAYTVGDIVKHLKAVGVLATS